MWNTPLQMVDNEHLPKEKKWKCWLKTQHSESKIIASGPITSWQKDGNIRQPSLPPEKPVCRSRSNTLSRHRSRDWFKLWKEYIKAVYYHPLFNLYAEYIMWNVRLDEAQAGIKIAGRNVNNLRYADDTTLTAESEEELKSFLMKVKEDSEKLA